MSLHTTAALILNEDEKGLKEDMLNMAKLLIHHLDNFEHNKVDHNAMAHLVQIIYGHSLIIPVGDGLPLLGNWQHVLSGLARFVLCIARHVTR